ncbi:glycosyltransferase family 2 protein [Granulicella sp. dw_53]|uniref:glycosyltransferase family 2 protein n=1 Tax=Granulicella sp. dw_53 TaxID=2719792 RepID=UPI001BD5803C|nr:glycosyltransferase family 2 protein [Granulicella sp. dw_53]
MEHPLVSIVVSSYNRPDMLQKALSSVLEQSFQNIEVIVQDDSPGMECEAVVTSYNDPRIRYTHNRPSLGTGANLRAGYRKCTGKYFSTLNDDDLYGPGYLERMVAILEANPTYSMAFSDHYLIDGDGTVLQEASDNNSRHFGRATLPPGSVSDPIHSALITMSVPGMFALYRAEAMDLDDFPDEVSSGYDYWLVYLAVRSGQPIHYTPERLTSYRVHGGSQTASFQAPKERMRSYNFAEYIDHRILADERVRSVWPDVRQRLSQMHTSGGFANLRLNQRAEARQQFLLSIRNKATPRALAGLLLTAAPTFVLQRIFKKRYEPKPAE